MVSLRDVIESSRRATKVAGGLGFEPRQPESESGVLPLDDPPMAVGAGALALVSRGLINASPNGKPRMGRSPRGDLRVGAIGCGASRGRTQRRSGRAGGSGGRAGDRLRDAGPACRFRCPLPPSGGIAPTRWRRGRARLTVPLAGAQYAAYKNAAGANRLPSRAWKHPESRHALSPITRSIRAGQPSRAGAGGLAAVPPAVALTPPDSARRRSLKAPCR